jgi:hypothetical protein
MNPSLNLVGMRFRENRLFAGPWISSISMTANIYPWNNSPLSLVFPSERFVILSLVLRHSSGAISEPQNPPPGSQGL